MAGSTLGFLGWKENPHIVGPRGGVVTATFMLEGGFGNGVLGHRKSSCVRYIENCVLLVLGVG